MKKRGDDEREAIVAAEVSRAARAITLLRLFRSMEERLPKDVGELSAWTEWHCRVLPLEPTEADKTAATEFVDGAISEERSLSGYAASRAHFNDPRWQGMWVALEVVWEPDRGAR